MSNHKGILYISCGRVTPARTHSISGLKFRVSKLTFSCLKMMVKSGLEFILKLTEPLQSCCCPVQKSRAELAWQVKGQLISKWFFGSSISSKKRTNKFDSTTMMPQVDLFLFVFWRKLITPKPF